MRTTKQTAKNAAVNNAVVNSACTALALVPGQRAFSMWQPVRIAKKAFGIVPKVNRNGLVAGQRGQNAKPASMHQFTGTFAVLAQALQNSGLVANNVLRNAKGVVCQLHGGKNASAHIRVAIAKNGSVNVKFKTHAGVGDRYNTYEDCNVANLAAIVTLPAFKAFYGL